jgi:hypothetical protein
MCRECDDCPPGFAGIEGTCSRCLDGTEPNPHKALCVNCALNTYSNYDASSPGAHTHSALRKADARRCTPC